MYNVYTNNLGWNRKDIDRTKLFVIFNIKKITENGIGTIFHSLLPLWSFSTTKSFFCILCPYELNYVTVSLFCLFSLNCSSLISYSLVSLVFTMWQHKILVSVIHYFHHAATQDPGLSYSLFSPCGNTRSWSRHQICDTSFFLFILKFYDWSNLLMWLYLGFWMLEVTTSSVVWSQVRWFFVLEYFYTINHDE